MTQALLLFVSLALGAMSVILVLNLLTLPRLGKSRPVEGSPTVSILVPARNEAANVGGVVDSLLKQQFTKFELLLLDDHSDDSTAKIARERARGDNRFRLMQGRPLPAGWLGKSWACQQLADTAQGDVLIFTDADVRWQPQALEVVLGELERSRADLLAVFPTQRVESFAERLCVPLIAFVVHAYLPVAGVHHSRSPLLAAANGQCMVFRRRAYARAGGHGGVRGQVIEDIALARMVKRRGMRLRLTEADGLISCRMYRDWRTVREGFAKSMVAGYGGPAGLAAATLFHWLVFLAPASVLGLGLLGAATPAQSAWAAVLLLGGIGVRAISAWRGGLPVGDAVLLPLAVAAMTCAAAQALWWHVRHGGPLWKGRKAVA